MRPESYNIDVQYPMSVEPDLTITKIRAGATYLVKLENKKTSSATHIVTNGGIYYDTVCGNTGLKVLLKKRKLPKEWSTAIGEAIGAHLLGKSEDHIRVGFFE